MKVRGIDIVSYQLPGADFQLTILPDPKERVDNIPNGRPTIEWLLSLKQAEDLVAGLSEGIDELTREK